MSRLNSTFARALLTVREAESTVIKSAVVLHWIMRLLIGFSKLVNTRNVRGV